MLPTRHIFIFQLALGLCSTLWGSIPKKIIHSPKTLSYNSFDRTFALSLLDIQKNPKKTWAKITELVDLHKKTTVFSGYTPILDRLGKISVSSEKDLGAHCTSAPEADYHAKLIVRTCFERYRQLLTTTPAPSSPLLFLKENPDFFISWPQFSGELLKDVRKSHGKMAHNMSSTFEDYFTKKSSVPHPVLLREMTPTTTFQAFLQEHGHGGVNQEDFHSGALKSLYGNLKDIIETNLHAATEISEQIIAYSAQHEKYIRYETTYRVLTNTGFEFFYSNDSKRAKDFFQLAQQAAVKNKQSEDRYQAIMNLFIVDLTFDNYKIPHQFIKERKLLERFDEMPANLKYWIAYILEIQEGKTFADYYYKKILDASPLNFYSIVILRRAGQENSVVKTKYLQQLESSSTSKVSSSELTPEALESLTRAKLWLDIGQGELANTELDRVATWTHDKLVDLSRYKGTTNTLHRDVFSLLSKSLSDDKRYLDSFKIAFKYIHDSGLRVTKELIESIFPFEYYEKIKTLATKVDPIIVLSLIRQESAFDPQAKSSAGARGLMQLMPATASQVNKKRLPASSLFQPQKNLELGISFFDDLLKKYEGNLIFSLAAYNAGPHRIDRWKARVFKTNNPLLIIESIPFIETSKYVKLIYRNIFFYQLLDGKLKSGENFEKSFYLTSHSGQATNKEKTKTKL